MTANSVITVSGLLQALVLLAAFSCAACRAPNEEQPSVDIGVAETRVDRGPVKVHVQVRPNPARLSDEPSLTLTVEAATGIRVVLPPFGDGIGEFLVLDFREPLPEVREGVEIRRQIYSLEPTRTGALLIDPIVVKFFDERESSDATEHLLETEAFEVQINSVIEAEIASLDDLEELAPPKNLPTPGLPAWVWWTAGTVLIAALFGTCIAYFRNRRVAKPALSPYAAAIYELDQLRATNLGPEELKRFYVDLTGIVRRYIERTTGVQAAEQTTEEFLREISSGSLFDREQRERLRSFLESSDLVKFAAYFPDEEDTVAALSRARNFIQPPQETADS